MWHVDLLGGLTARSPQEEVRFRAGHRAGLLLASLLLSPAGSCAREHLIERFWPDADRDHGHTSLRSLIHQLRAAIEARPGEVLSADRVSVWLRPGAADCDVWRFRKLVEVAASEEVTSRRVGFLREAVSVYRGELLPGFYDEWVDGARRELADAYVAALDCLARDVCSVNGPEAALPYAHMAVRSEPYDDARVEALLRLQIDAGHQSAAAKTYRAFRRRLRDHMNAAPSRAVRALAAGAGHGIARSALADVRSQPASAVLPGRLPLPLTRFVGRQEELALLCRWLAPGPESKSSERLVTLTGPGGVGKTRLAVEVARRLWPPYNGSIWFIDLAHQADAGAIPAAVRAALGICDASESSGHGALGSIGGLFVLDNVEQMGPSAGLVIAELSAKMPAARWLATSRRHLLVSTERTLMVAPLAVPEPLVSPDALAESPGVDLFVDRARAVMPGFALTTTNAGSVTEICRRLDGLPLAIEMAAARVNQFTPHEVLDQLGQRFQFTGSTARRRSIPQRHESLWATCDWSFQLLPHSLQRFFAGLGVFRASFSPDDAHAVVGGLELSDAAEDTERLLRLVACSLVVIEGGEEGYRLRLLETLREFAREQQSSLEGSVLPQRLAEHVAATASGMSRQEMTQRVARQVDYAFPDIVASLEWCRATGHASLGATLACDLAEYWKVRGRSTEWFRWLRHFVDQPGSLAPGERDRALRSAMDAALGSGDAEAVRDLNAELDSCSAADGPATESPVDGDARRLLALGVAAHTAGDYRVAVSTLTRAVAVHRRNGNGTTAMETLGSLGEALEALGLFDEAATVFDDCLRACAPSRHQPYALAQVAAHWTRRGDLSRAETLLGRAVQAYEARDDRPGVAICRRGQGVVATERGAVSEALAALDESLALWRQVGVRCPGVADVLGCQAAVARRIGDLDKATRLCHESLEMWRDHGHSRWLGVTLARLACVRCDAGDLDVAADLCARSLELVGPGEYNSAAHTTSEVLGRVCLARDDQKGAAAHLGASLRERLRAGFRVRVAETLEVAADLFERSGDLRAAPLASRAASRLRRMTGTPHGLRGGPCARDVSGHGAGARSWRHNAASVLQELDRRACE